MFDNNFKEYSICEINSDKLINFTCGNIAIDNFLKNSAKSDQQFGQNHTKIFFENSRPICFFSLSASLCIIENGIIHPAIEMVWLGVDKNYQRKGYGRALLDKIVSFALDLNETNLGVAFITGWATDDALNFYKKYGFENIEITNSVIKKENLNYIIYPIIY